MNYTTTTEWERYGRVMLAAVSLAGCFGAPSADLSVVAQAEVVSDAVCIAPAVPTGQSLTCRYAYAGTTIGLPSYTIDDSEQYLPVICTCNWTRVGPDPACINGVRPTNFGSPCPATRSVSLPMGEGVVLYGRDNTSAMLTYSTRAADFLDRCEYLCRNTSPDGAWRYSRSDRQYTYQGPGAAPSTREWSIVVPSAPQEWVYTSTLACCVSPQRGSSLELPVEDERNDTVGDSVTIE